MIGTSIHFLPVHRLTAYRELFPDQPPLPVAERAGRRGAVAAALARALGRRHRGRDRRPRTRARAVRGSVMRSRRLRRLRRSSGRVPDSPARSRRRSSSRASASPTSSGRSISARPSHILGNADSATSSVRSRSWTRDRVADGVALAAAAARAGDPRPARLADARVLRRRTRRGRCCRRRSAATRLRIFETSQRHPGHGGPIAGSVLLERALGGAATLALAAVGFALAIGNYDVGAYLWIELALRRRRRSCSPSPLFSRRRGGRSRGPCRCCGGCASSGRSAPSTRACTPTATTPRLLIGVFALTLAIQAVRVLAIWLAAKAVGVDLSPRLYYVMGPLLFLVMLVPFTINGLAVREAFFVSFLGQLGVDADARLRDRLPLLPRDDRAVGPGRADPGVGERSRGSASGHASSHG